MAKKAKMIDLKSKALTVSDSQLEKLQNLVNGINGVQFKIGNIETTKHSLLHEYANIQNLVSDLQNELKTEYGTFDVNLKDGTINYPADGEALN